MEFHVLTLLPDLMKAYTDASILGIAQEKGVVKVLYHQLREYAKNKHKSVDDKPYGGGPGMVFRPEVVVEAIRDIKSKYDIQKVIYLSPRGSVLSDAKARALASEGNLLFLCGRYEGIDQRALDLEVDEELSIGDFVVTGGELPALVAIDAISRMIPGVLGDEDGAHLDSFSQGLLEHDHYTRPEEFEGVKVPEVLLSGNHEAILKWREKNSRENTLAKRPDLIKKKEESHD